MCLAPVGNAGFVMLIASSTPSVQYTGIFLGAIGIYPSIPVTIPWIANNTEGVYKRGVVLGFVIGWDNINGIVSSNVWLRGPRFYAGHGTVIGYMVVSLFGGVLLARENQARTAGKRDHWVESKTAEEVDLLGDRRPDFLYTL
jgi:hypothetical protein